MLVALCIISISTYIGSVFFHSSKNINKSIKDASLRVQQLDEISSEKDQKKRNMMEKAMDRNINIATFSLFLSAVGSFFYWPLALLSVPGTLYVSLPVYRKTYQSLKHGKLGTELLVSIIMTGGILGGYYFVTSFGMFLFSLSFKLLNQVTEDSKHNIIDIFRSRPDYAWVMMDGIEIKVAVDNLTIGQVVVVNGGEIIPVDGIITEGLASIDEHHLTGEFKLNDKGQGERVFASTMVLSGKIYVMVEKAGNETTAAKIGTILNNTIEFKSSTQLRAERLADKTVLPTLIISGVAFPILGPTGSLAIVNAHYRDMMTIVSPISIMNFINIASQKGILIKDGRSLDLLNQVDTIVFDKTGTLTEEQPQVWEIYPSVGYEKDDVLRWAAAAEQKQHHPLAKAILEAAKKLDIPNIDETEYTAGYGLTVKIDKKWVRAGSLRFMELLEISIPPNLKKVQTLCHELGHSLVLVAIDNNIIGAIELLPLIRPEIKEVISQLRKLPHIKTMYIISGDHEAPTRKLAEFLGIDNYFSEILPKQKSEIIAQLQSKGKFICYIGDGLNDSIALKKAQVSISLRGASSVAIDTAQIVLMDGKLTQLASLFNLARDFDKNINTTFAIVLLPTVIGIGGVFFMNFGFMQTTLLNLSGLAFSVRNIASSYQKQQLLNNKR